MRQIKLDAEEKKIMEAIERNEYVPVGGKELREMADAIAARKKNMTLTIRVNSQELTGSRNFRRLKVSLTRPIFRKLSIV